MEAGHRCYCSSHLADFNKHKKNLNKEIQLPETPVIFLPGPSLHSPDFGSEVPIIRPSPPRCRGRLRKDSYASSGRSQFSGSSLFLL